MKYKSFHMGMNPTLTTKWFMQDIHDISVPIHTWETGSDKMRVTAMYRTNLLHML